MLRHVRAEVAAVALVIVALFVAGTVVEDYGFGLILSMVVGTPLVLIAPLFFIVDEAERPHTRLRRHSSG